MPRYVILYHQQSPSKADLTHWDLMLENDGTLRTWQIYQQPVAGQLLAATPLPDHRIDYLQYEGPVSRDRGHVSQWDRGTFTGVVPADSEPFSVQLKGDIFRGLLTLAPPERQEGDWQVLFSGLTVAPDNPLNSTQMP